MNKQYLFWVLIPHEGFVLQQVIENNFKRLCGKVYRPYDDRDILILALQKDAAENQDVLKLIDHYFVHHKYSIGKDVENAIHDKSQGNYGTD